MRTLITGGAGFIGSHLCERFLERGHEVICVDNTITGTLGNVEHLRYHERFSFIRHDISHPLEIDGTITHVLHFASPASPVDYLKFPIQTLKVGSLGTHNTLGLAKAKGARYMIASTSEVYGDPEVHPQREDYWGNVNPVGVRGCYDEAKRFSEAMVMAYHRAHGVDTRIIRIFNSVLGDQSIVAFDGGGLFLGSADDFAHHLEQSGGRTNQVFVPAFDPATGRMEVREACAFIKHAAQNDAFELRLRYGRSVKVTGDHSVFVRGEQGRPVARPVREIQVGDHVAIPARLPVIEKDRVLIDLARELPCRDAGQEELWRWAIKHPTLTQTVRELRPVIYRTLRSMGRYRPNPTRGLGVALANQTAKWARRQALPLALAKEMNVPTPDGATFGPMTGSKCYFPNRFPLTDDLLWLCGFFLAEGTAWSKKGRHFLSFSSDGHHLDRAANILRDHFPVRVGRVAATPERAPSLWAHSLVLHELFTRVLDLGRKRVPNWVLQLPLSRLKHFLEGYRCGDGTHSGKKLGKELCFDTTSEDLANGLIHLLLRFGIVACLGRYQTTFRKKYGDRKFPFFRITICELSNFDILTWDQGVEQTLNARREGDLVWARVKEVRPCVLTGHVYDFSVPGAENFVAGSGVSCHNTYGSRMRLDDGRVLPNFVGQALRGEPLTVYGDGSQTRSFCYVEDLVNGIEKVLFCDFHEPINLGNPDEVTILEFAREILDLSGSKSEIVFRPLPLDDPKVRKPDITRARTLLGWEPKVNRREGLKRTLDYFQRKIAQPS